MMLTEESFHGSGGTFAGNWAAAVGGAVSFTIDPNYTFFDSTDSAGASGGLLQMTKLWGGDGALDVETLDAVDNIAGNPGTKFTATLPAGPAFRKIGVGFQWANQSTNWVGRNLSAYDYYSLIMRNDGTTPVKVCIWINGSGWAWYQEPAGDWAEIGPGESVTLSLALASNPNATDVKKIGFQLGADTTDSPITAVVSIIDLTAPVITCPGNISVSNGQGVCSASVQVGVATATDYTTGVASVVGTRDDGLPLGNPYPVGITTITWVATDKADPANTSNCTQTITVTDDEDPTITCPPNVTVYADPGTCGAAKADVDLGTPATGDNCGVDTVTNDAPDTFPIGDTTVTWTVTDIHSNSAQCLQTVTVRNRTQAQIEVELAGVSAAVDRTIKFTFGGNGGAVSPYSVAVPLLFTGGKATVSIDTVPACADWTHVSAKDEQHTLCKKLPLTTTGGKFTADFTGSNALAGGDATNDNMIDILDFGVLIGQYGQFLPLTTTWPVRNADFGCDGDVDSGDFTFIHQGFLTKGDLPPGPAAAASDEPRTSVSVAEFSRIVGLAYAAQADLDGDGVISLQDLRFFLTKTGNR
ncbi:MAG: hypothetical protein A2Z18_10355 [Armatimonadetes bacterium RBG_16_58_9]|nr:MAG: hypothetical protein A2Z18_10355 [Armatimonadetes bacterium RBG_16_58_9]